MTVTFASHKGASCLPALTSMGPKLIADQAMIVSVL